MFCELISTQVAVAVVVTVAVAVAQSRRQRCRDSGLMESSQTNPPTLCRLCEKESLIFLRPTHSSQLLSISTWYGPYNSLRTYSLFPIAPTMMRPHRSYAAYRTLRARQRWPRILCRAVEKELKNKDDCCDWTLCMMCRREKKDDVFWNSVGPVAPGEENGKKIKGIGRDRLKVCRRSNRTAGARKIVTISRVRGERNKLRLLQSVNVDGDVSSSSSSSWAFWLGCVWPSPLESQKGRDVEPMAIVAQ